MKKTLFALVFIIIFSNCDKTTNEITGLYVSKNNINTIDSVWIKDDNTYLNLMYRKKDNSLVYKNIGKWSTKDNYIILEDFFADEDEEHSLEFTRYEDVLMTLKLPLERDGSKIIIHHKSMHDNIYLEKLE